MNFTPSIDGEIRATVQTRHRVGLEQLVVAAQDIVESDMMEDPLPFVGKVTRTAVERRVRDLLTRRGDSFYDVGGEEVTDAVRDRVRLLFPEVAPR